MGRVGDEMTDGMVDGVVDSMRIIYYYWRCVMVADGDHNNHA